MMEKPGLINPLELIQFQFQFQGIIFCGGHAIGLLVLQEKIHQQIFLLKNFRNIIKSEDIKLGGYFL